MVNICFPRQRVEFMAKLGGLLAAAVSGGEAAPVFPSFNKVMLLDGTTVEPKRVVPVYGIDGQLLFGSACGVVIEEIEDISELPAAGPPMVIEYNQPGYHLEGGRVSKEKSSSKVTNQKSGHRVVNQNVGVKVTKQKSGPRVSKQMVVKKRIKQNIIMDEGDDSDYDQDFPAIVSKPGPSDRSLRPKSDKN